MKNNVCIDTNNLIFFIIIMFGITIYGCVHNIPHHIINDSNHDNISNNDPSVHNQTVNNQINYQNPALVQHSQSYQHLMDRVYNPLRYPYRSMPQYNNYMQPVFGHQPRQNVSDCPNTPFTNCSSNYVNNNMHNMNNPPTYFTSPVPPSVSTQGPIGIPQQMGTITNTTIGKSTENVIFPLYGRRKYHNDQKWEYYTIINGAKIPIRQDKKFDELYSGDPVTMDALGNDTFSVNIYDSDFLEYNI